MDCVSRADSFFRAGEDHTHRTELLGSATAGIELQEGWGDDDEGESVLTDEFPDGRHVQR